MAVRRTLALLLAAPAVLMPALVAGCGDDSSVADPPVASASPTVVPSGPPQRESAEHFIRRFADEERRMENTGDTSAYVALANKCSECLDLARQIKGIYKAGGYVHWAGWTIERIGPYTSDRRSNAFKVTVKSAPTAYKTSAGSPTRHLKGGPAVEIIRLRELQDGWAVVGRARLSS
jgi:hypothetical protein